MITRFSLGEFCKTPLSQKIKVAKYNAGIGEENARRDTDSEIIALRTSDVPKSGT